jgi:hypothetical protein
MIVIAFFQFPLSADEKPVKPQFNGAYFGKMPRAWVEILKIDPARRSLTVRTKKGDEVTVPIRGDTELRVRDSWGDLSDYYPGESVMLFVYHDAEGKWVYPRAVQDEIQMMSQHKWWWTVDAVDRTADTVQLSRRDKDKVSRESFRIGPATKVWKGDQPAGPDTLKEGDVVLFQTRYEQGQERRFAVELLDAKGLQAIKAAQQARHRERLLQEGLPAVVNDLEVLTGAVTISTQWTAEDLARKIKAGDRLSLKLLDSDRRVLFEAPVAEAKGDGVHQRILLAADPATMVRLRIGDEVRALPVAAK